MRYPNFLQYRQRSGGFHDQVEKFECPNDKPANDSPSQLDWCTKTVVHKFIKYHATKSIFCDEAVNPEVAAAATIGTAIAASVE